MVSLEFFFLIFLGILAVVVLLIILVLLKALLQYRQIRNEQFWTQFIDEKVSQAIIYGNEKAQTEALKKFESKTSYRDLFLEKLVASGKKFSGTAQSEIRDLFEVYSLKKEAVRKINQKKPYLIAGGIQELTAMKVVEFLPQFESFLSHPDPQVYLEAQYAMVSFKGFEGLNFLSTTTSTISEWQQLRLLLSVPYIPENCDGTIKLWLESPNKSIVIFTLSLLRKFQKLSFYSEVFNLLLEHPFDEVRIQAVKTLQSLENDQTVIQLVTIFPNQSLEVQNEILKALKFLKDFRNTEFLKEILLDNENIGLKILAAEALYGLKEEIYLRTLSQEESSPEVLVQILKHALKEKIC